MAIILRCAPFPDGGWEGAGTNAETFSSRPETAFGYPRDFHGNRFVYVVISPRAGGLSVGVNMNPDKKCNFDCIYCEVDRSAPARETILDLDAMDGELRHTLAAVQSGALREDARYRGLSPDLLQLHHVTLSGDGEPTIAANFLGAVETVSHVRATGMFGFFKLVLVTNGTGLDLPQVQQGLKLLNKSDEVWVKLDGATQSYLNLVNRPDVPVEKILANILMLGRQRPVVIQSLFPSVNGSEPTPDEIGQFARSLKELKANGAQISFVQIYSATRPIQNTGCGHLPLKTLFRIAQTVRDASGLKVEVL